MTDTEFWDYVENEGLEYFLNYKTDAWKFLFNKELLALCLQYVDIHEKIMNLEKQY